MDSRALISDTEREFHRSKRLVDRSLTQVSDEQFFRAIDCETNSIAVLTKHLAGNMRSRWCGFLTSDGEKPDRQRDKEFQVFGDDSRTLLEGNLEAGWRFLFDALAPLEDADLQRIVHIRQEPLSVSQALCRQLSHYGYHVGQIVLLAKHFRENEWGALSIPRGKSEEFNIKPSPSITEEKT